jgi:hypothetical protein
MYLLLREKEKTVWERKEEIETVSERSSRQHAVGNARAIIARGNLA